MLFFQAISEQIAQQSTIETVAECKQNNNGPKERIRIYEETDCDDCNDGFLITTTAFAEGVKIDGSIKSAETKTILAPYSGVVGHYAVTAGDAVNMGDALLRCAPNRSMPILTAR